MNSLKPGINDLLTINPELAREWDYSKNPNLTPEQVTYGSHTVLVLFSTLPILNSESFFHYIEKYNPKSFLSLKPRLRLRIC